jgi:16S rRNA (uracil1498-N3)-methyltransferase
VDAALAYWKDLQGRYSPAAGILLHETPLEKGSFHRYLDNDPALVAAAVGPEGGFSPEELSRFLAAGFKPLTIGNTVLRTETAALYAIAAIRVILLENSTWMLKTL